MLGKSQKRGPNSSLVGGTILALVDLHTVQFGPKDPEQHGKAGQSCGPI